MSVDQRGEQLTNAQLQYICRETFQSGLPLFRQPYKSPEQIEEMIWGLRTEMIEINTSREDYIAVLRVMPGRFTAPDELTWFLGLNDLILRKDDHIMSTSNEKMDDSEFVRRLSSGSLYGRENEFSTLAAGRFLLNSQILLSHPRVITSYNEIEENKGVYGVWEKKFPSKETIETVSEEVLYGKYGRMNAAETMESFLGMLTGGDVKLPKEVRNDLIRR